MSSANITSGTAYGLTLSGAKTLSSESIYTINANGSGAGTLTFSTGAIDTQGGSPTLTFNMGSGTGVRSASISGSFTGTAGVLTLAGTAPVTIGSLLTGTGNGNAIQVSGTGTYTFNGTSAFTGGVILNNATATVIATTAGGLGATSGKVKFNTIGTTLRLQNDTDTTFTSGVDSTVNGGSIVVSRATPSATATTHTLSLASSLGGNTITVSSANINSGTPYGLKLSGTTTLSGSAIFNVANNGAGIGTLTLGAITGAGNRLTVQGAGNFAQTGVFGANNGSSLVFDSTFTGTAILSQANTFNGGLTIANGTVVFSNATAGGGAGGTITLGEDNGVAASVTLVSGTTTGLTFANPIVLASGTDTFTIAGGAGLAATTFSGGVTGGNNLTVESRGTLLTFSSQPINMQGALTIKGPGTTTISGGIGSNVQGVTIKSGAGAVSISGATTLQSSNGITIESGASTVTLGANTVSASQSWFNNSANTFIVNGLTTAGGNTLTLDGTGAGLTTLTGGLSFTEGGKLVIGKSGTLGTTIGGAITLGSSGGITINNSASAFSLGAATVSASQSWLNNSGTTATATGILALGANALTLGGGNWQFGGANTGTGTIYLNAGNLIATVAGAFGPSTETLSFGGGNLELRGGTTASPITYTGKIDMTGAGTTITINPASLGPGVTQVISGAATLGGDQTMVISAGSLNNPNPNYGLTLSGNKTLGNSTYTINGNGSGNGTLTLSTGTINTQGGCTLTFNAGTGTGIRSALIAGAFTGTAGTLELAGTAPVTIGALTGTSRTDAILVSGTGPYTFNGASTFTGGVTLSALAGTVNINLAGAAGNGPLGNGGPFAINGSTIDNTSGLAIVVANVNPITIGGNFAFSTSAGTANNNLTLPGAVSIAGTKTITLNGAGALTLKGKWINTSDSPLTLTVNKGTGTTGTTLLTIGTAATASFDLSSTYFCTDIINGGANVTIAGIIANGGGGAGCGLTYSGTGTLTLGGANTYSGNTTVSSGTLKLSGTASIVSSPVITIGGGATFDLASHTGNLTLGAGQTLQASGSTTGGTLTMAAGAGLTLNASSPLKFTAFKGGVVPLTLSGAGTLTLGVSTPVTVTVANGTPLSVAGSPYKLIAKGASGTVANLPGGALQVDGDGATGTCSLQLTSGELFLVVAAKAGAYRSYQTGTWNNATTWERYNGSIWVQNPSEGAPSSDNSDSITILSGHNVTVTADVNVCWTPWIVVNSGGTMTVDNGVTVSVEHMSVNGTLVFVGESKVDGGSVFALNSGATLVIGSANGITAGGWGPESGNIRNVNRTFSGGANYIYSGTAAQVTGNGLPVTLAGNLTIANGTGTGVTLTQSTAINTPGICTVNNGALLTMGAAINITGSGTFTLSSGGALAIGSTDGITAAPDATGNIQTTTRNLDTGADYTYNGTLAQVTGNGLPATIHGLIVNNSAGVTLTAAETVSGTLALGSSGMFKIGATAQNSTANALTIAGVSRPAGTWGSTGSIADFKDDARFDSAGGGIVTISTGAGAYRITAATGTPTAGAGDQLTVTFVDAGGSAVTSFNCDKALTFSGLANSPSGAQPVITDKEGMTVNQGTATTITFVNGVSSPASGAGILVAKKAGSATLHVTDGTFTDVMTGGQSLGLVVGPAMASKLVFTTDPSGATAGRAFTGQPVVMTHDAYGNDSSVGLGVSKMVTIAIKTGTGTLDGTIDYDIGTGSGHGNGTITGSGLSIDQAGDFTLSATAESNLTAGDSGLFTVSPPPPTIGTTYSFK